MLSEIDAEKMGRRIVTAQREGIREGMESDGADPEQVEAALTSFDHLVARANATNLALKVVDENVLARAVETINEEFGDQPVTGAALQQTVARTYREIGLYERAMPLQEACLRTRRRELGDDHSDTLNSINIMASLLQSMGKLAEAERYFREALERRRRVLGDDHPATLTSIGNLARLLVEVGKSAEGERLAREAVEGERRVLGEGTWDVGYSLGNHGYALTALKRFDDAERVLQEGHGILVAALGTEHQQTTRVIGYLVALYNAWDTADPGSGYSEKADEWRAELPNEEGAATLPDDASDSGG